MNWHWKVNNLDNLEQPVEVVSVWRFHVEFADKKDFSDRTDNSDFADTTDKRSEPVAVSLEVDGVRVVVVVVVVLALEQVVVELFDGDLGVEQSKCETILTGLTGANPIKKPNSFLILNNIFYRIGS